MRPREPERRGRALSGAVGALCRALPPGARPAPDTFRRARFDRPQASLHFWRLLYALLKQIHRGKWTESDAIDNQITFVKSALWYHGYGRPELYRLPSDGSAGSRELLLAFSWLLHRLSLLEQLLARNRVKTGDEISVCTCEDDLPNSQEGTTEVAPEYRLEDRVDVRYLQWLNGRLRFQWRSLHAQHQEQCKLLHKIHLFTSGAHMDQSLGHFSVTETDLVRQPENYKQLLQLLESETMQLEAFLEWKQLEPVYWQWMEAVLDNMAEEGNLCQSQDADVEKTELPKATSSCPWADSLTGQIDRLSRDLMALRDQLHKLLTHRKAAWCEKAGCRGWPSNAARVTMAVPAAWHPPTAAARHRNCELVKTRKEELQKEGFSVTASKIQENVELKLLDLTRLCTPKKNKMHGLCRLVFSSKHPAGKMGSGRSVSKGPVSAVSAAEVIRELRVRAASLERELRRLREECGQRLAAVTEGLDGVICIAP